MDVLQIMYATEMRGISAIRYLFNTTKNGDPKCRMVGVA